MLQVIEGSTEEVHSILNRMVSLLTQSTNGTNENSYKELIDKEVQQLKDEINRIVHDTE